MFILKIKLKGCSKETNRQQTLSELKKPDKLEFAGLREVKASEISCRIVALLRSATRGYHSRGVNAGSSEYREGRKLTIYTEFVRLEI